MSLFCPLGTHYQTFGKPKLGKSSVVFIHGVGLDLSLWQSQVDALKAKHHIITYDMLGHGLSPHAPTDISLSTLAKQLDNLLDYLKLKRVHLIGFSLGGLVAGVFATQYIHQLHSLTIMSSVFDRNESLRKAILKRVHEVEQYGPSANIDQALTRWFSPLYTKKNPSYIAQLRACVLSNHKTSYSRCYRLFGEGDTAMQGHLNKITCPTLVTTGELDPGSTPAMSRALAHQISLAKVFILPNARHMMPVEKAQEVNELLQQFISTS